MEKNEKLFIGFIVDGLPSSKGILEYRNGDTYFGYFDKGVRQGLGLMEYSKFDDLQQIFFAGNFLRNEPAGNGTIVRRDGLGYGEFQASAFFYGNGLYSYSSGIISKGFFKDGHLTGSGTRFFPGGERYKGNF